MVRFKNRYIVLEINIADPKVARFPNFQLKPVALHNAIIQKVQSLHGDFGFAAIKAGFTVKYCNEHTRVAFVRIRHGPHRLVASCLPFIFNINGTPVSIRTLYTGATLLQCSKFLKRHQRQQLDIMWSQCRNEDERKKMEAAFATFRELGDRDYGNQAHDGE